LSDSIKEETVETVEETVKQIEEEKKVEEEKPKKKVESKVLEESEKDKPTNLEVDTEATPLDFGALFGRPNKKYHMEC